MSLETEFAYSFLAEVGEILIPRSLLSPFRHTYAGSYGIQVGISLVEGALTCIALRANEINLGCAHLYPILTAQDIRKIDLRAVAQELADYITGSGLVNVILTTGGELHIVLALYGEVKLSSQPIGSIIKDGSIETDVAVLERFVSVSCEVIPAKCLPFVTYLYVEHRSVLV